MREERSTVLYLVVETVKEPPAWRVQPPEPSQEAGSTWNTSDSELTKQVEENVTVVLGSLMRELTFGKVCVAENCTQKRI